MLLQSLLLLLLVVGYGATNYLWCDKIDLDS